MNKNTTHHCLDQKTFQLNFPSCSEAAPAAQAYAPSAHGLLKQCKSKKKQPQTNKKKLCSVTQSGLSLDVCQGGYHTDKVLRVRFPAQSELANCAEPRHGKGISPLRFLKQFGIKG